MFTTEYGPLASTALTPLFKTDSNRISSLYRAKLFNDGSVHRENWKDASPWDFKGTREPLALALQVSSPPYCSLSVDDKLFLRCETLIKGA